MDLAQLIQSRRTVHNYTPEKVPDALVEKALELSLFAPNHKLTYPWVYTWISDAARKELGEANVKLKAAKGELSPVKAEAARQNVTRPSHLISIGIKKSGDEHRQHEDYATLACSVQIASLFLWEHGIATKWSTGAWSMNETAYKILGLNPAEVSLEGALMIGKAEFMPKAPDRPKLASLLRR
jgi:nitroreductase